MNDLTTRARQHSLGDLPRRSALRHPDKTALVDGDVELTYAELEAGVEGTAAAMHEAGVRHGDRVAVLARNCWQFPVLSYACARIGAVLVPINFMLGADEVAWILEHSGATTLVTQTGLVEVAEQALAAPGSPVARRLLTDGPRQGWDDLDVWTSYRGAAPEVVVADDDPVRLMYTSGTESRPKGALLTSRSLMWQYVSCVVDGEMSADDVDLHTLPLYHCAQLDCFLNPDVYLGATSILLPGPDPATVLRTIAERGVTKFFAPPTVWISLLRHPDFDTTDLSSLRQGYYGASAMPVEVLKEIQERLPELRLWNFYGQTEMAPLATILRPHEQLTHPGSAGRPGLNVETRIVDDADRELPTGEVGEIVHRSPHACAGYYLDEARTDEAFRNGWFHSGDLGRIEADGHLYVVDRKKDMIKTGGENVASREVEEALYAMEGLAEAAVFGIDHPHWVEAVAAVVVAAPGHTLTPEAVVEHARGRLAGFKVPKFVVVADALPKNPSGKILKRELRAAHADLGRA